MSSETLIEETKKALALPPRERFVRLKAIGFQAISEYKTAPELPPEDIKKYIEILRLVVQIPSPPAIYNKWISTMTVSYLKLNGCENPTILFKKSTSILIECGTISFGDRSFEFLPGEFNFFDEAYIQLINNGKLYSFSTGGDGEFNIQVRIIEAPEPVLSLKEYKNVVLAGPCVTLHFPTGRLAIDDGIVYKGSNSALEFNIAPGNYKSQVFLLKFRGYVYSYYIVLAKTHEPASNHETNMPDFNRGTS